MFSPAANINPLLIKKFLVEMNEVNRASEASRQGFSCLHIADCLQSAVSTWPYRPHATLGRNACGY